MIEQLLLNISNKACLTYLLLGGGLGNKSIDFRESYLIIPQYFFLTKIMNDLFIPLKRTLHNLDNNLFFLDIDEKFNNIRISCDWCSLYVMV